jgi:hypothetical protein
MDPEEKKQKRDKRYTRRVELRKKFKQRSGEKIARGEG